MPMVKVVLIMKVSRTFLPRSKITKQSSVTLLIGTQKCVQNSSKLRTQLPLQQMAFRTKSMEFAITSSPIRDKNLRTHLLSKQNPLRLGQRQEQEQVKQNEK